MLARIISATCCSMGLADVAVWVTCPAVLRMMRSLRIGVGEVKMVPESKRARKYIDSITLCFDLRDMTLDRMELCETEGGHSVYEFRNKRFNLPVDPARFNP